MKAGRPATALPPDYRADYPQTPAPASAPEVSRQRQAFQPDKLPTLGTLANALIGGGQFVGSKLQAANEFVDKTLGVPPSPFLQYSQPEGFEGPMPLSPENQKYLDITGGGDPIRERINLGLRGAAGFATGVGEFTMNLPGMIAAATRGSGEYVEPGTESPRIQMAKDLVKGPVQWLKNAAPQVDYLLSGVDKQRMFLPDYREAVDALIENPAELAFAGGLLGGGLKAGGKLKGLGQRVRAGAAEVGQLGRDLTAPRAEKIGPVKPEAPVVMEPLPEQFKPAPEVETKAPARPVEPLEAKPAVEAPVASKPALEKPKEPWEMTKEEYLGTIPTKKVSISGLEAGQLPKYTTKAKPVTSGPIVTDRIGRIRDGHHRVQEAIRRGDRDIEAISVDDFLAHRKSTESALSEGKLTPEQAEKLGHFKDYPDLAAKYKAPAEMKPALEKPKEPWEMTRDEFAKTKKAKKLLSGTGKSIFRAWESVAGGRRRGFEQGVDRYHEFDVRKPSPLASSRLNAPNIHFNSYPDLAAKYKAPAAPATEPVKLKESSPVEPKLKETTTTFNKPKRSTGDIQSSYAPRSQATASLENISKGKPVRIEEIRNKLSKDFGLPIRTGRFRSNFGTMERGGIYKGQSGVVRLKEWNDLTTLTHEVAHHLDKKFNLKSTLFRGDKELPGLDYSPNQKRPTEGFAEFVRGWMTGEDFAQTKAPKFAAKFEAWLDANPATKKTMVDSEG